MPASQLQDSSAQLINLLLHTPSTVKRCLHLFCYCIRVQHLKAHQVLQKNCFLQVVDSGENVLYRSKYVQCH